MSKEIKQAYSLLARAGCAISEPRDWSHKDGVFLEMAPAIHVHNFVEAADPQAEAAAKKLLEENGFEVLRRSEMDIAEGRSVGSGRGKRAATITSFRQVSSLVDAKSHSLFRMLREVEKIIQAWNISHSESRYEKLRFSLSDPMSSGISKSEARAAALSFENCVEKAHARLSHVLNRSGA
jgi:hypothetical protein